jgi:hypothetical protein
MGVDVFSPIISLILGLFFLNVSRVKSQQFFSCLCKVIRPDLIFNGRENPYHSGEEVS